MVVDQLLEDGSKLILNSVDVMLGLISKVVLESDFFGDLLCDTVAEIVNSVFIRWIDAEVGQVHMKVSILGLLSEPPCDFFNQNLRAVFRVDNCAISVLISAISELSALRVQTHVPFVFFNER